MDAPNDPEAPYKTAPSQEPLPLPLPPAAATGLPVAAPPPQLDYVPWSTGLWDCSSDFKRFCISFWCPCVTFGQISEIVDRGDSSCVINGAIYFLKCARCYAFVYRLKMRKQYRIAGSAIEDFVIHCCCEACALTQEYRELQNHGFDPSLGWLESMERQNHGVAMAPVVEDSMKR